MLSLKSHNPDHLFTCISYCGKLDRIAYKFEQPTPLDEHIIHRNAGFSETLEPGSRNEMIAKGALEWLREFHEDPASFSLSNTSVKTMHRKLFKYSPRDDGTRGRYRTQLDHDMRELYEEIKTELAADDRHPLFTISLFRVSFINAMPFITGNSLSANLISYALLFNNAYALVSHIPLLASLNNADSNDSKDQLSLLPKILYKQISNLSAEVRKVKTEHSTNSGPRSQTPNTYLNPRRKLLLSYIQKHAPLKISDIMAAFPGESRNTIKKDLLYLRENEMIIAQGEGRGMYYRS